MIHTARKQSTTYWYGMVMIWSEQCGFCKKMQVLVVLFSDQKMRLRHLLFKLLCSNISIHFGFFFFLIIPSIKFSYNFVLICLSFWNLKNVLNSQLPFNKDGEHEAMHFCSYFLLNCLLWFIVHTVFWYLPTIIGSRQTL